MKIKLRRFRFSDLEEVTEIEKASFPKRKVYSKSLFEKYYKEYSEGFLVAKNENEIVGLPSENQTISRPKSFLWQ